MCTLRWIAVALALAGVFVPAIGISTPWGQDGQWSVWQLSQSGWAAWREYRHPATAGSPAGGNWLNTMQAVRADLPPNTLQQPGVSNALRAALLLPVATLVAGLAALLTGLLQLAGWRGASLAAAATGGVAALAADATATWLNRALQTAWAVLANSHNWLALPAAAARLLDHGLEVNVQPGLYLVLTGLVAVLLLPAPSRTGV